MSKNHLKHKPRKQSPLPQQQRKILGLNLTDMVKTLYHENYKTLMKEVEHKTAER